jgi:hypothetical protein
MKNENETDPKVWILRCVVQNVVLQGLNGKGIKRLSVALVERFFIL